MGQDTKHHSMNDFTHHTAKAAVVLLGGRSLPQIVLRRGTSLKTERIEGSERIGNHKRLVVGGSVKNPRKSKEPSPCPYLERSRSLQKLGHGQDPKKTVLISPSDGTRSTMRHSLDPTRAN